MTGIMLRHTTAFVGCCLLLLCAQAFGQQAASPLRMDPSTRDWGKYKEPAPRTPADTVKIQPTQATNEAQSDDFGQRLNERKISEYASFDRALFGRSFDVGYGFNYLTQDTLFSRTRSHNNTFSISTGLSERIGISASAGTSKTMNYLFGESAGDSTGRSGSLELNGLLMTESAELPRLVAGLGLGRSTRDDIDTNTQDISLSTSRTLESASLFTSLSVSRSAEKNGPVTYSRSLSASYFLVINHRLTAGVGYSLAKGNGDLAVPGYFTSVVYRPVKHWVVNFTAGQSLGEVADNNLGVNLVYTVEP